MKLKLYTLLIVLTLCSHAQSQFTKGDKWIGGSVSFSMNSGNYNYQSTSGSNYHNNSSLNPRFSWVTSANHTQGILINMNYGRSKSETSSLSKEIVSDASVGTGYFFRSYKDIAGAFGWFIEYNGVFNYYYSRRKSTYPSSSDNKSSGVGVGVSALPGLYYRITNPLLIEASFGGIGASYFHSVSGYTKSNSFSAGINFPSNFAFGVQFLLSRKK